MRKISSLTIAIVAMLTIISFWSCTKECANQPTNCVDTLRKVVTPAFAGLTSVQSGTTNAPIASFDITPLCESKKVTQLVVQPMLTGMAPTGSSLMNVSLYYKGVQIGSTRSYDGFTPIVYNNLGGQLILLKDSINTLVVKADIYMTNGIPYSAGTIKVKIWIPVSGMIGFSSNVSTQVIDFPITTGLSVNTDLILIAKNPALPNTTTSPNTAGVKQGSFVLRNTNMVDPFRVTNIDVRISGTTPLNNFTNIRTSEMSGNGGVPIGVVQASQMFSVDFILPPGTSKVIDIFFDQGSLTGGTVITSMKIGYLSTTTNVFYSSDLITGQTMTIN
ncbi:MAG: hypothetical protein AAB477_02655 [Patescibacteria group bacterium]